uniref:Apolipoprotein M n=1 Tax=Scophthalmus maximus TaxID=52904 RepID=A0A8D3AV78_SCOMX
MFAVCAVAFMCLMSVSHSAPMACEKLVQPLNRLEPHKFQGKWALIADSLNNTASMEALRRRDSITLYFSNSSGDSTFSFTQINRFGDLCQYLRYNVSVQHNTFNFDVQDHSYLTGSFLYTSCPDCVVMQWSLKSRSRTTSLLLLSRRREVGQKEMEEFREQLRCYQLPTPVVMDPTKDLCPEQSDRRPTAEPESNSPNSPSFHNWNIQIL